MVKWLDEFRKTGIEANFGIWDPNAPSRTNGNEQAFNVCVSANRP
jgi:hypothetical protein